MDALVPLLLGVKVAVYLSGLLGSCRKLLSVPPSTWTSLWLKSALGSDRVKVTVLVSPGANAVALLVMATAGGTVSMVKGVRLWLVVVPFCVTCRMG